MSATTKAAVAVLDSVRERFLDRLGDRCLEIETLMLAVDERGPEPRLIKEIAMRAHKTAGIAPTLGFKELGDLALKVETLLGKPINAEGWSACRPMVEELLDQIEAVLDEVM